PYDNRPIVQVNGQPVVNPLFNPYVTIDYIETVKDNNVNNPPWSSQGKRQPFASRYVVGGPPASQIVDQAPGVNPTPNSFGQQNGPGPVAPMTYLAPLHLDRQLVSPMELLNVSGFKPHQLLQQFIDTTGQAANQHLVHWYDDDCPGQSHRLYRLFEYLQTSSRVAGAVDINYGTADPFQGQHVARRMPGKININTIWDPEILLALVDPQQSNNFAVPLGQGQPSLLTVYNPSYPQQTDPYAYDPTTLFGRLVASRSPGLMNKTNPGLTYYDQPFTGFSAGLSTGDAQNPPMG